MKIIERIERKFMGVNIGLIFATAIMTAWLLAGAPIPGRYQIAYSRGNAIARLDTVTGHVDIFGQSYAGHSIAHLDTIAMIYSPAEEEESVLQIVDEELKQKR